MSDPKAIDAAHIASLARLNIRPEAFEKLRSEMQAIVGYVEMLSELDVSGIEPTAHAVPRTNVLREDETHGSAFSRSQMLANAPETVDGELIRVPRVLPGEEVS